MPPVSTAVKRYVRVVASSDKKMLALITENGWVQIVSSDLKHCVCECDSGVRSNADQFLWCGSDAVALYAQGTLTLIGLNGGALRFPFDEPVYIQPEVDGLRLYSQTSHEFLGKVPDAVKAVYQIASTAPGALLLEASEKYKMGSYEAYDFLRMIENELPVAVRQCLDAAANEYNVASQKTLLQAAAFGKAFAGGMEADCVAEVCRKLRLLNAVRERLVALPLSYSQLERLTVPVLLDRLIARSQWPLAISLADHLRLEPQHGHNRVLAHWAAKIMTEQVGKPSEVRLDAAQLADVICQKFDKFPGVSYADVASKAAKLGLKELATLLVENEPQVVRQVRMSLELGDYSKAISKATESEDPDLISFVIMELKRCMQDRSKMELLLRRFPGAFALYKQLCLQESPEHLRALFRQEDDFVGQALCHLREAQQASLFDVREKQDSIQQARQCFGSAKEDFLAAQLDDQVKLLKQQADLEEQHHQAFIDLSLRETIVWLVANNHGARAEMMRKEFRLSDKQWWWWRVEALAQANKWDELEAFSKSKKSPIGYIPFAEMCIKFGSRKSEAEKYLTKVPSEDKVKACLRINWLEEAAEAAFQQQDETSLNRVQSRCGPQNRALAEKITHMKQQLNAKKK